MRMKTTSTQSRWGSVALVSYVPAPLGTVLDRLRHALSLDGSPKAHVTLLPPRPLMAPVEKASAAIQFVLQQFQPFEIQFSTVHRFPDTNVIYLNITEGNSSLNALHDCLNSGVVAHTEIFEYLPHLTLSCPLPIHLSEEARQAAENAWKNVTAPHRFSLEEAVLLWASPGSEPGNWQRLWTRSLGTAAVAASAASSPISHRT